MVSEITKKAFHHFCEEYNKANNTNLNKKQLKEHWSKLDNDGKLKYKKIVENQTITTREENQLDPSLYKQKKACTPYIHYLYDPQVRSPVKEKNPNVKSSDLTKIIAKQWNELSEKEREPWVEKSNKEKSELRENPIMVKIKKPVNKTSSGKIDQLELMVEKLITQINQITASLDTLKK